MRRHPARWLAGALMFIASIAAAEERLPLVVLELEARGVTPLQAQAATLGAVRGLRGLDVFQVLSADDVRQLLAIERNRAILADADSTGAINVTRALGARHAVVGSLTQAGRALDVELRLLDVAEGKVLSQKALTGATGIEPLAKALPGLAQELVAPLLRERQGRLLVQTKEEGAEVLVDDVLVGSTPLRQPVLLSQGTHRLVVRKDGFIAQAQSVRIQPNETTLEMVTLVPSPDYAEAWRMRHGRLRLGAYLATGLTVAALGGAYLLDRKVADPLYREEFRPRQLALQGSPPLGLAPDARSVYEACGKAEPACRSELQSLETKLTLQQIGVIGLGLVGVGAGVSAGYLWLTGKDPNRYAGVVAALLPDRSGAALVLAAPF